MLRIETPNPGLMKLSRFKQEPLGRKRFAIYRLHVLFRNDTPVLSGSPGTRVTYV